MKTSGPVGIIWWPHSGGRWLCRSLLGAHPRVHATVFAHPWCFVTTDMTLELDNTTQVHKARSLPELQDHLGALVESTERGRVAGLRDYFDRLCGGESRLVAGELCMGTPRPRPPDLSALLSARSDFRFVLLVRDPLSAYPSFRVRHELDGDAAQVAGSWVSCNAQVRLFAESAPPGTFHIVRYEDLQSATDATIARLCDFLKIEFDPQQLKETGRRWGRSTADAISERDASTIRAIADRERAAFGYDSRA